MSCLFLPAYALVDIQLYVLYTLLDNSYPYYNTLIIPFQVVILYCVQQATSYRHCVRYISNYLRHAHKLYAQNDSFGVYFPTVSRSLFGEQRNTTTSPITMVLLLYQRSQSLYPIICRSHENYSPVPKNSFKTSTDVSFFAVPSTTSRVLYTAHLPAASARYATCVSAE